MPAAVRSLARFAAPGIFILSLAAACSGRPGAAVATVNGESITRAELDAQVRVFRNVHPDAPDNAATRRQVLEQMLQRALLVQAARRGGLDKDPRVQAEIHARRDALRAELERGIRLAQDRLRSLDRDAEADGLMDAFARARRGGITVTAQDLQDAYAVRAQAAPLPPLGQVRDQLLEQVLMEKMVEEQRLHASIRIDEGRLK